jgi:hypothetical protein
METLIGDYRQANIQRIVDKMRGVRRFDGLIDKETHQNYPESVLSNNCIQQIAQSEFKTAGIDQVGTFLKVPKALIEKKGSTLPKVPNSHAIEPPSQPAPPKKSNGSTNNQFYM